MSQKFLSDVVLTTLSSGILKVDADGKIVKAVAGTDYLVTGAIGALDDLSDVVISSPSADQILVYGQPLGGDPGVNVWYNKTPNYLTSYTETDPIYTASSWYTTTNNASNWDTAYGWGNHAGLYASTSHTHNVFTQAYTDVVGGEEVTIDGEDGFVPASGLDDGTKFLRGDGTWQVATTDLTGYATETWVGQQGYLTSYTETDPVFAASEAYNIRVEDTTAWDTAYGWGDHSEAGYITGNETITLSGDVSGSGTTSITVTVSDDSHNHTYSQVSGISDLNSVPNANNANFRPFVSNFQATNRSGSNYNGGFEVGTGAANYGAQFTFQASAATTAPHYRNKINGTWGSWYRLWGTADFSSTDITNWNTAYGWGNHATAGYITADDQELTWNGATKELSIADGNTVTLTELVTAAEVEAYGYIIGESDTLDTVTNRGATTTNAITIGGLTLGDSHFIGNQTTYDNLLLLSSANENIVLSSAVDLYFNTGGTSAGAVGSTRMFISGTNGNVGVGTTSPTQKLDVAGHTVIGASGGGYKYYIKRPSDGSAAAFLGYNSADNADFGIYNGSGGGNVKFWSNNGIFQFNNTASGELMRITSGGNVGIGTTSPASKLTVYDGDVRLYKNHVQANTGTWSQRIYFTDEVDRIGAAISGFREQWTNAPMGISFSTGGLNTITERMRITSGGNVGIGTTSPAEKLHVAGNIAAQGSVYPAYNVSTGTRVDGSVVNQLRLWADSYVVGIVGGAERFASSTSKLYTASGIHLESNGSLYVTGTGDSYFSNGKVGIGTTSPSQKLHVSGASIIANNTTIDPDSYANSIVAGNIADGSGWGAIGIGGNAGTGDSWAIAHNGSNLYFGIQNGTAANTMNSYMVVSPTRTITLPQYGAGLLRTDANGVVSVDTATYVTADDQELTWEGSTKTLSIADGNSVTLTELVTASEVEAYGYIIGESDTLATVTSRGASTTGRINVRGIGNQGGGNIMMGNTGDGTTKWSYLTGTHYNADTQTQGFSIIGGLSTSTDNAVIIGGSIYESNPATQIQFWTHTATTHNLGGTQRGVITSSGNWGIGTNSPSYKLDVNGGTSRITYAGYAGFEYHNTAGTWEVYIGTENNSGHARYNSRQGDHTWYANGSATMKLNSSGNLGIGTTSPGVKLDVNGSIRVTGRTTPTSGNGLEIFYYSPSDLFYLEAYNYTTSAYKAIRYSALSHQFITGNVGIGTTSPSYKLDVNGSARLNSGAIFGDRITVSGNVENASDRTYDIGTDAARWRVVYCETLDSAGQHESNLANEEIQDLPTGTVLVWKDGKAVPCSSFANFMKIGVSVNGHNSPLVQGAEPVLCTGDIEEGDYLVTSEKIGHAVAMKRSQVKEEDLFDCVIGKALEAGSGNSHLVKTWINI